MPNKINNVPEKRPETETPAVADQHDRRHPSPEEKIERAAGGVPHKAARTGQNYGAGRGNLFSIGPNRYQRYLTLT